MNDIDQTLHELKPLTTRQLQLQFEEVYGEGTRSSNRVYLIRRIIWGMQMQEEGGLSERAKMRAEELARIEDLRIKAPSTKHPMIAAPSRKKDPRLPRVGTFVRRTYKGREIKVRVLDNGFEWEGSIWRSLSAVVKEITGANWNGFHFFNLNKKASE